MQAAMVFGRIYTSKAVKGLKCEGGRRGQKEKLRN